MLEYFVGNSLEVLVESLLGEGELADEEAQVAILVNTEVDFAALLLRIFP